MIDASNNIASSRTPNVAESSLAQLRASPPASQQPPSRQAESTAGVEVQISTAAREAAARDPVPSTMDPVGNANAQEPGVQAANAPQPRATDAEAANASPDPAAANAARGTASNEPSNSSSRQAIQLFMQNNGTGNEAPSSPLRASA